MTRLTLWWQEEESFTLAPLPKFTGLVVSCVTSGDRGSVTANRLEQKVSGGTMCQEC